ncbi:MAG: tetratricopeptide repeat protein [Candidatus Wallbacteria bacterium]|nr:tetratricopeptide repeat protein [Candidatus Wallbacteria bacterium]
MSGKPSRLRVLLLALPLAASTVLAEEDGSFDDSACLARSLRHHEMHGLLGADARMEDMLGSGRSLFESCRFEAAAVMFQVATRYYPDSAAPWFALGQARFATGDYTRAAAALREGLEIDPYWSKIDYSVYGLYGWPNDLDAQVRLLKDYLRDRADDRNALFILGFFQYHLTRNDQARATFIRLAGMSAHDDNVAYYMRLLGEKEKMRLERPPYGPKPVHHRSKRRSSSKGVGKPLRKAKPAKHVDSPSPATPASVAAPPAAAPLAAEPASAPASAAKHDAPAAPPAPAEMPEVPAAPPPPGK